MRKYLLTFLLFGSLADCFAQNDPLYNQYQVNQLLINPAYAGVNDRMTATWITRAQWMGIPGAPVTNTASVHSSIKATNMGLGAVIMNDKLGINTTNEINVQYSYRLNFRKTKLQFGLQGGLVMFNSDPSKLTLEWQDDPALSAMYQKFTKPTIGAGMFYYGDNFFIGLSIPRFLDVKVSDGVAGSVRYRRSEYLSAGYVFTISEGFRLKPSTLLKYTQGSPISIDMNINALLAEKVWVGLTLRNFNAIGLNTMLQINDKYRFGYTYEYAFKPISYGSYGTHELMIAIDFAAFSNQQVGRRYF